VAHFLPTYAALKSNFKTPAALTTPELADQLGGKVEVNIEGNLAAFGNTCAIRISRALNGAGHLVPYSTSPRVISDKDRRWYIYSVSELSAYLKKTYGPPYAPPKREMTNLSGMRGIIIFHGGIPGATGHADLWNGSHCEGTCYLGVALRIELWEAPSVSPTGFGGWKWW